MLRVVNFSHVSVFIWFNSKSQRKARRMSCPGKFATVSRKATDGRKLLDLRIVHPAVSLFPFDLLFGSNRQRDCDCLSAWFQWGR